MAVVDPTRQMEFDYPAVGDHIFVRLPLAGSSETWIHEFKPLARTKEFWADVQELPEGTVLTVKVPAAASREEAAELLDGALRLDQRGPGTGQYETLHIRADRAVHPRLVGEPETVGLRAKRCWIDRRARTLPPGRLGSSETAARIDTRKSDAPGENGQCGGSAEWTELRAAAIASVSVGCSVAV